MKPVKFLQISILGKTRKPRLTPVTRSRLQYEGVSFFGIAHEYPETAAQETGLPIATVEEPKDKPSIDDLFDNTIGGFLQSAKKLANKQEPDKIAPTNFNLPEKVKKQPIVSRAKSFPVSEKEKERDTAPEAAQPNGSDELAERCVMVVEDDSVIAGFLSHMLSRRGFDVQLAEDGREAAKMLETINPPRLVILDIMLPFIDGFELIKKIRKTPKWEETPIMMLTSKTHERDIVRALDSGANDYIFKPFQSQELIARVDRFMR